MAFTFGDSFDLYAAVGDAAAGYWDSLTAGSSQLSAGRFGGQAFLYQSGGAGLVKTSGQNDALHHIVVAFRQTAALTGSTLGVYFQFSDGATNQCCIVFRSDGTVLLTSATPGGTVLATYSGAVTAANTWFAFEFEVIINNTTGRFRARKNGNTSDDFDSGATLNTRPGANPYANKLSVFQSVTLSAQTIDDFLWRSDSVANGVAWVGDIRGYARMPASDVSTQWAKAPSPATSSVALSTTRTDPTGTSAYTPFTAAVTGTVGSIIVNVNTGFTGNMKCSIFADSGASAPGAIMGSATTLVNPTTGNNTFVFGTPVAVAKGTTYWFGVSHDVSAVLSIGPGATVGRTSTTITYAAFPTATPGVSNNSPIVSTVNITPTVNADYVSETLQDGTTSYVYDATTNDADLYAIASIGGVPSNVVAVTTRGFFSKSDAGARGACVQLKSGATTATSTATLLSNTFGWLYRTDVTDPATGSAWTGAAVDALTIGPKVTS